MRNPSARVPHDARFAGVDTGWFWGNSGGVVKVSFLPRGAAVALKHRGSHDGVNTKSFQARFALVTMDISLRVLS